MSLHLSPPFVCLFAKQYDVRDDGCWLMSGDRLGVTSENAGWNLIAYDEDVRQKTFRRRRQLINGSRVFADLPRLMDVVDDFTQDTAPTRFSVAVQVAVDSPTTTVTATSTADSSSGTVV